MQYSDLSFLGFLSSLSVKKVAIQMDVTQPSLAANAMMVLAQQADAGTIENYSVTSDASGTTISFDCTQPPADLG